MSSANTIRGRNYAPHRISSRVSFALRVYNPLPVSAWDVLRETNSGLRGAII